MVYWLFIVLLWAFFVCGLFKSSQRSWLEQSGLLSPSSLLWKPRVPAGKPVGFQTFWDVVKATPGRRSCCCLGHSPGSCCFQQSHQPKPSHFDLLPLISALQPGKRLFHEASGVFSSVCWCCGAADALFLSFSALSSSIGLKIPSVLFKPSLPPNVSRSHCVCLSSSSARLGCSHRQPKPVNNSLWSWN